MTYIVLSLSIILYAHMLWNHTALLSLLLSKMDNLLQGVNVLILKSSLYLQAYYTFMYSSSL